MKKNMNFMLTAMLVVIIATSAFAQTTNPFGNSGSFTGGIGMTVIDDQSYMTINLRPDLAIGKFGLGLNVNLLYNTDNGAIRGEDWDEDYDWARLIRYVRYGRKGDTFYTKVGALDAARIGHGFIMNYYTNEASYDDRKIGLALDLDFGTFGFESMTNNLGRLEVIGGRAFVRPLRPYINIPIIKNLTFGTTFVSDVDPDGSRGTDDAFNAFGLDVELPLINLPMFRTYTYFDWAKLDTFGTGTAVGIAADLKIIAGVAEVTARLERRFLGKEFIPSFFDAFYEVQRYQPDIDMRKGESLAYIQEETKGTYGELVGHILNTIQLVGNFQRLDDTPNSGVLHFAAETKQNVPMFALQATYDKMGIEQMDDVFTLDDRSIARLGIGYKVKPYLVLFMDYIYTFQFDEDLGRYKAQERFSPRVAFVYNFGF
ncbi:hypothetical protein B6I21_03545 [candidate division KSB1 bacterium 4572_119]|nr:MAG: hypothetical protein B6I21_03545 [candidate division KSB1 bacterium 4572_119]